MYAKYIEQRNVEIENFKFHDCRENTLHNIFNNIVYHFGTSVLDTIPLVKKYYENTYDNHSIKAATEWTKLLSGLEGVHYWYPGPKRKKNYELGRKYELNSGLKNILAVMSKLLDKHITSLSDLEETFRSKNIDIKFEESSQIDDDKEVLIYINNIPY